MKKTIDTEKSLRESCAQTGGKQASTGTPFGGQWFSTKGFRANKNGVQSNHFSQPRARS